MRQTSATTRRSWSAGVAALAVATFLLATVGLSATATSAGVGDEATAAAPAPAKAASSLAKADSPRAGKPWNGNGAPSVLKTAPTGTSIAAPAKNTIWPCPDLIPAPGGVSIPTQLTEADTPWVKDGEITVSEIVTVPGAVKMKSVFKITETKKIRSIRGNGIPNHPIGTFPIPESSPSYKYYAALPAEGYANAAEIPVAPYDMHADLPMNPKMSEEPYCLPSLMTGYALTGAAWHIEAAPDSSLNIYDPNAALPTDRCFGHPYATEYHYHGYSWKCMKQGKAGKQSPLLGYALDGFGIYGPRGADGKLITNAQLDECHGRVGEVMFNGKRQVMYHYVLNNEYPYSIGCFRGKPRLSDHLSH